MMAGVLFFRRPERMQAPLPSLRRDTDMTVLTTPGIELRAAPTAGSISTDELRARLGDDSVAIVDVRPVAAYNGWRLRGEARGGHVPSAVSFPAAWLESVEAAEVHKLLGAKGVLGRGTIVVYGYGAA